VLNFSNIRRRRGFMAAAAAILMAGCSAPPRAPDGPPLPIIALPDLRTETPDRRYVMLRLPYGLIVSNMDYPETPPLYCLFCRDERRIVKTRDLAVFLAELERLPDRAVVDWIDKCTVPFCSEYGVNLDRELAAIRAVERRQRFQAVRSLEDDPRHAGFCYCEGGFTILDRPPDGPVRPAP